MTREGIEYGTCGWDHCPRGAVVMMNNATTVRLNETWLACFHHAPDVARFIHRRDKGWGLPRRKIDYTYSSRVGGGGDPS